MGVHVTLHSRSGCERTPQASKATKQQHTHACFRSSFVTIISFAICTSSKCSPTSSTTLVPFVPPDLNTSSTLGTSTVHFDAAEMRFTLLPWVPICRTVSGL